MPLPNTRPASTTAPRRAARSLALAALSCLAACAAERPAQTQPPAVEPPDLPAVRFTDQQTPLPNATVRFDICLPAQSGPAPLVVIAHGFARSKANMALWAEHFALQGYVAAALTMPAFADHPRNARSIRELTDWLARQSPFAHRIDAQRIAYVGFSAGGLATLLAAADNPAILLWIGLDPVDRDGLAASAAPSVHAVPVFIRAEPAPCNAHGNAAQIELAFAPRPQSTIVPRAVHTDAEWPTDPLAESFCGSSNDARRAIFVQIATDALKTHLPVQQP